jgi:hypothetical protein
MENFSMFLNTGNCELRNGVVFCTGKAVYPVDNGSESREIKSTAIYRRDLIYDVEYATSRSAAARCTTC